MLPDSEYVTLITYATKLEIYLCNFLAIWAVLSILLDTKSNNLQYVQCLQQVVNYYYDTCTKEAMTQLEQQASKILDIMYDSMNNTISIAFQIILIEFQMQLMEIQMRSILTI